jgi:hypothetical protein
MTDAVNLMNAYVTNRTVAQVEVHRVGGPASEIFWVGLPLARGWSIQAQVLAKDEKDAEHIARCTIRTRWPQYKDLV